MRQADSETPEGLGADRHPDAAACAEHFRALRVNELALCTVVVAEHDRSYNMLRRRNVIEGRLESASTTPCAAALRKNANARTVALMFWQEVASFERLYW